MVKAIRKLDVSEFDDHIALSGLCDGGRKKDWTTLVYQCELITPMYGGGVEPRQVDDEMPIRETSIRGQLRFWWRLLYRASIDQQDRANIEREIWGGISTDPNKICASAVQIRIKKSIANLASTKYEVRNGDKWECTSNFKEKAGIAYGAFSAKHDKDNLAGTFLIKKCWKIKIKVKDQYSDQIRKTISYWGAFGGVGSRSRRGFGAIQITDQQMIENAIPDDIEIYTFGEEFKIEESLKKLDWALNKYKNIRQGFNEDGVACGYGRKKRNETDETRRSAGRSNWPEADLIRRSKDQWFGKNQLSQHQYKDTSTKTVATGAPHSHEPNYKGPAVYPRASFGLPIVIHFIDYDSRNTLNSDPSDTTIIPADQNRDRFASPIILRPIQIGDGNYRMGLIILPGARAQFRCKINGSENDEFIGPSHSNLVEHQNKTAWRSPIDFLIKELGCEEFCFRPVGRYSSSVLFDGDDWGKLYVKYLKETQTFIAKKDEKNATAFQTAGKKLFDKLNNRSREKLRNGGCHFRVIVDEKSIIDLIEDQA